MYNRLTDLSQSHKTLGGNGSRVRLTQNTWKGGDSPKNVREAGLKEEADLMQMKTACVHHSL